MDRLCHITSSPMRTKLDGARTLCARSQNLARYCHPFPITAAVATNSSNSAIDTAPDTA